MRGHVTLFILLGTIALGACGTRGPLTLPPPAKVPASAPAPSTTTDLNTAKEPAR